MDPTRSRRRWAVLATAVFAQGSGCLFIYGLAALVPQIRAETGISLAAAGMVIAAPTAGLLLTLFAWGALADRIGEQVVLGAGMLIAGAMLALTPLAAALPAHRSGAALAIWALLAGLAGAGGASANAASGRLVLGWFAPAQRGVAMGIRQMAQPIGVASAALLLPPTARAWGVWWALAVPAALCLLSAALIWAIADDPPRPPRRAGAAGEADDASPYREPMLYRVHIASTFLVVPQFLIAAFSLAYLVSVRQWDPVDAGRVVFAGQALGALGRLGAGWWTDVARSRLRPMRQLAAICAAVMVACALLDRAHSPAIIVVLVIAAVVTVADNGMAYTAVAERAGPYWAGRALGAHNTVQNVASVLTPALVGALIGAHGYAAAFAVTAVFPLLAIALTPVRSERPLNIPPRRREVGAIAPASPGARPNAGGQREQREGQCRRR